MNRLKTFVHRYCELTRNHLTPEFQLYLLTKNCKLFHSQIPDDLEFQEPFWAIYWSGGQGLTRYLLDNSDLFEGKTVLDIGSGCGAQAMALAKVTKSITVNDIDESALLAAEYNFQLNSVPSSSVKFSSFNFLDSSKHLAKYDYILIGDLLYDEKIASSLKLALDTCDTKVLFGDPGRPYFPAFKNRLNLLQTYDLKPDFRCTNGLAQTHVYSL